MNNTPENRSALEGLAERRNDLALRRTLLANERTYSAWVRTGLAAVAAGLGIAHLLCIEGMAGVNCMLGGLFILAGCAIYFIGLWRYQQQYHELKAEGLRVTPTWALTLLTAVFILSALLTFILIIIGNLT
jgi:putative membrane protein